MLTCIENIINLWKKLDNCKDVIKLIENCLKDKFIVRALRKVKRTIKNLFHIS